MWKLENKEMLLNLKKYVSEEKIKINEPMKKHTSFKIGGPAEFFVKVSTLEELKNILRFCKDNKIPLTVIGNGSNLLVTEKGIKGVVIKLELKEIEINNINSEKRKIIVDSGVPIGLLAQKLLREEITGFEELSGIPGTIGGAIVMNAGAHGKEMKDIVTEVTALDYDGNIYKFTNNQSEFTYRHSKFSNGDYIIIQTILVLEKGKKEKIKEKMDEYGQYRREKQPIEFPNAGSTFKRGNDFITAKLIDEAGLKGYSIGGAQISEKHAGFIINKGNATSQDVLNLIKYVTDRVYKEFGKKIELEIQILGE